MKPIKFIKNKLYGMGGSIFSFPINCYLNNSPKNIIFFLHRFILKAACKKKDQYEY